MWEQMQDYAKQNIDVLSTSHNEHMDMLQNVGYAYMMDYTVYETSTDCDLDIMKTEMIRLVDYAVAFQNNSAYTNMFTSK